MIVELKVKINEVGCCKCLVRSMSGLGNDRVVLGKALGVWEFLGRWCPRKELPRERLSADREDDLLACLDVCFGRS